MIKSSSATQTDTRVNRAPSLGLPKGTSAPWSIKVRTKIEGVTAWGLVLILGSRLLFLALGSVKQLV